MFGSNGEMCTECKRDLMRCQCNNEYTEAEFEKIAIKQIAKAEKKPAEEWVFDLIEKRYNFTGPWNYAISIDGNHFKLTRGASILVETKCDPDYRDAAIEWMKSIVKAERIRSNRK